MGINEAAKLLGVSIKTLRRWDKDGKLKAFRKGERGHRFYKREDLELFKIDLIELAKAWATRDRGQLPDLKFYCQNSAVFNARLTHLTEELKRVSDLSRIYPLVVAIAGEIGNNSFDHNLGNWPDVMGVFFGYDIKKREIVLADRGRGILQTLRVVRPNLADHKQALRVAFTEVVSGRAPESRGNGLKFVRHSIVEHHMSLVFQSGDARLTIKKDRDKFSIKKQQVAVRGCLACIKF